MTQQEPDTPQRQGTRSKFSRPYILRLFLFTLVVFPLCIYVIVAPIGQKDFWYGLIFQATHDNSFAPEPVPGCEAEGVKFTAEDKTLHGWYYKRPNDKGTVLLQHGTGGTIALYHHLVKHAVENGFSVFVFDYEGYGLSDGTPSMAALLRNGEYAYDYLIESGKAKKGDIISAGASIGTCGATHVAAVKDCKALWLWTPYCSLLRVIKEEFPIVRIYPDFAFPEKDVGSKPEIANVKVPIFISHGTKDHFIPSQHSVELHALAPKSVLAIIPGAAHGPQTFFESPLYIEGLHTFLKQIDQKN